jgi:hypothetical protein
MNSTLISHVHFKDIKNSITIKSVGKKVEIVIEKNSYLVQ